MEPNNTNSIHTQGWTPEPNGRGTMSILWTCLFTVFLCTWTVVHPSVRWATWKRKILLLLGALLVPEALVAFALEELVQVWSLGKKIKELKLEGWEKWTWEHGFFTYMHGWVVEETAGESADPQTPSKRVTLKLKGLLWMVENGYMPLPSRMVSKQQLLDRSKQDSFAKVVAICQSTWLVVQCIARRAQHLPLTTLELSATGFVLCSIITWAAWWRKPKDIEYPIMVPVPVVPEGLLGANEKVLDKHIDNIESYIFAASGLFSGALFGAIHCLAWNFHFPTAIEATLWKVASVIIIGLPLIALLFVAALAVFGYGRRHVFIPLSAIYILARLYLMMEAFSSLRASPAGVYQTVEWTQYWPILS